MVGTGRVYRLQCGGLTGEVEASVGLSVVRFLVVAELIRCDAGLAP